ncbi:MAG: threonine synthase [Rickettsiales bacterium]|jgi:threonine synthase|nr:threonine synthase [Rickettsiales bacterium]
MRFISTRGKAKPLNFCEAMLSGLASDGGLYIPETYPSFNANQIAGMANLTFTELAFEILSPYILPDISEVELKTIIAASYNNGNFKDKSIAPLKQIDSNHFVLELFHGPTLAFKDFALQLFGRLLDLVLTKRGESAIIIGATSGDTGSAAIAGCTPCKNAKIFILHPHNKISEVQRKQMTTFSGKNIFNLAVEGSFDDCQETVKTLFMNKDFVPDNTNLISVNSINCARILAQIIYYFYSATKLGSPFKKVSFSVPTGNFGDIFAGYIAKQMGLPIEKLIVATNSNDILHRFMSCNEYHRSELQDSLSPSMNIQVASNFERLLFDSYGRDAGQIDSLMSQFKETHKLSVPENVYGKIKDNFTSYKCDDTQTLKTMSEVWANNNYALDPHSAIAVCAGDEYLKGSKNPVISLATAHPAKFPDACDAAKIEFQNPIQLADIHDKEERYDVISNSFNDIAGYIKDHI